MKKTSQFDKWLRKLKDLRAKAKVIARIKRIESGNLGDFKQINEKLEELRIFTGPGYRIYFTRKNNTIILLLNGGDKST